MRKLGDDLANRGVAAQVEEWLCKLGKDPANGEMAAQAGEGLRSLV